MNSYFGALFLFFALFHATLHTLAKWGGQSGNSKFWLNLLERQEGGSRTSTYTGRRVRSAIDSGTPETQRRARKQLQRHQKHCEQKVSRAEAAGGIEKWTRPAAKDAARKRRKKGEEKNGRPCPNLVMVPSAHRPRRTQLSSFFIPLGTPWSSPF